MDNGVFEVLVFGNGGGVERVGGKLRVGEGWFVRISRMYSTAKYGTVE